MSKRHALAILLALFATILLGAKGGGGGGGGTADPGTSTGETVLMIVAKTEPDVFIHKDVSSVSITDSGGSNYPVTLRHLFRVYGDATSSYNIRSANGFGWPSPQPEEVGLPPYQGHWLAIVDLVDPVTSTAPTLDSGTATLTFNSPTTGDRTTQLEITSGTGQPTPFDALYAFTDFAPWATLEPMPQVEISASGIPSAPVAGANFIVRYQTASFGDERLAPRVVLTTPDSNIEVASSRLDMGDGTTQLKIMVINPHGFKIDDDADEELAAGMSLLRDLRLNLVWDKSLTGITDQNWASELWLESGDYFDLNGNAVQELVPALAKVL